jgi:hypothetical protein
MPKNGTSAPPAHPGEGAKGRRWHSDMWGKHPLHKCREMPIASERPPPAPRGSMRGVVRRFSSDFWLLTSDSCTSDFWLLTPARHSSRRGGSLVTVFNLKSAISNRCRARAPRARLAREPRALPLSALPSLKSAISNRRRWRVRGRLAHAPQALALSALASLKSAISTRRAGADPALLGLRQLAGPFLRRVLRLVRRSQHAAGRADPAGWRRPKLCVSAPREVLKPAYPCPTGTNH